MSETDSPSIPRVQVLLASFRGRRFIGQQIDSILDQSHRNLEILVRDDGSDDGTVEELGRIESKAGGRVRLLDRSGVNVGIINNFGTLLNAATADYVMFSDGDDVWLPDKVEASLKQIMASEVTLGQSTPVLVHTDLRVVGPNLEPIADSFWQRQRLDVERGVAMQRVLPFNCVTGSTIMMNRALVDLSRPIPSQVLMHDWWVALVAAATGHITTVNKPTVLYRQHGQNALGSRSYGMRYIASRATALFSKGGMHEILLRTYAQAELLRTRLGDRIDPQRRPWVDAWASMSSRGPIARRRIAISRGFAMPDLPRQVGMLAAM